MIVSVRDIESGHRVVSQIDERQCGSGMGPMSDLSSRALAARSRAAKRWYVYLILCRNGAVYTGIARDVAVRYAQHVAGTGARYTRANPPRRLLVKFACVNQSEAGRMEV